MAVTLLSRPFVGWDNPQVGTTVTVTSDSITPGTDCLLLVKLSVIGSSTSTFTSTTPSGGGLTWNLKGKTNASAGYNATSGIWYAQIGGTAANGGSPFTISATYANGAPGDFTIYLLTVERYTGSDYNPADPLGGFAITEGTTGNGAQSCTLSAAPGSGDKVSAQCLVDENTVNQYSTFGAGTWTLLTAGNDLNGDGTTTDTSLHQLAFNDGYRSGSTSTTVAWSDVNSGGDTWTCSLAAVVVKGASAGATDLVVGDLSSAGTLEAAPVTPRIPLTVADLASAATIDNVSFTVGIGLTVADLSSAATLDNATLTQTHNLTVAGLSSASTLQAANLPSPFPFPSSVSGRKILDQNGNVFFFKTMSAWGMAMRWTNAEITADLETLKAQGFNCVNVAGCGGVDVQSDWDSVQYENIDGDPFFTGTPFQSTLGSGFDTTDWIQQECERLGMVMQFAFFVSYGDSGCRAEMEAASNAQMRTFGQALATSYAAAPNVTGAVMGDTGWSATDTIGRRLDWLFRGITETRTDYPNMIFAEPFEGSSDGCQTMFIDAEGTDPTGYEWLHLTADGLYQYEDDSVVEADAIYAGTSMPVWDSEPPYAGATDKYGGDFKQQLRERNYTVAIRGYCGINYGDEDFWVGDRSGFYTRGLTPAQALVATETNQAHYAWNIVDTYITDLTWAPSSSFVTTGVGTGDTKAAVGASDTAALAYFPDNRTVVVDTTVTALTGNVRLRWYDPTTGTFSSIAASEAQNASRSVTIPAARGDGTRDFLLVVDEPPAPTDLTVADLVSAATLDAAPVTPRYPLTVADLSSAGALDAPTLTPRYPLAVADLSSAGALDNATLTAVLSLAVADLASAGALDAPTLTPVYPLTVADLASASTLDAPTLTLGITLTIGDLSSAATLDAPTLVAIFALTVGDLASASTLDAPTIVVGGISLTVADLTSAGALDTPTLTSIYNLVVADLVSAGVLESPDLVRIVSLAVADLASGTTLDPANLVAGLTLVVNDLTSATTEDAVTLVVQAVNLVVANLVSGSTLSLVSLGGLVDIPTHIELDVRPAATIEIIIQES